MAIDLNDKGIGTFRLAYGWTTRRSEKRKKTAWSVGHGKLKGMSRIFFSPLFCCLLHTFFCLPFFLSFPVFQCYLLIDMLSILGPLSSLLRWDVILASEKYTSLSR